VGVARDSGAVAVENPHPNVTKNAPLGWGTNVEV